MSALGALILIVLILATLHEGSPEVTFYEFLMAGTLAVVFFFGTTKFLISRERISKPLFYLLARSYYVTHGLPVLITRSSNTFGPRQYPEKLIPLMITNALQGKPLPVYGDGLNVRDWLYVEDNCRGIDAVLHRGKIGEVYNIGGGNEWRNIDLVNLICEILAEITQKPVEEYKKLITFVKDRPGHDRRYALSIEKIEKELEWKPKKKLREALKETVWWYINNDY